MNRLCEGTACRWCIVSQYENSLNEQPMIKANCKCGGVDIQLFDMVDKGQKTETIFLRQECYFPQSYQS